MPDIVWNLEWLNQNSQRSYPFDEEATQQDVTGSFLVPDDFLVSLYFPVHAGFDVQPERFFIRSIAAYAGGYTIALGYDDDSANPPVVASAVVARDTHQENNSYPLVGVTNHAVDFADAVGRVTIGRLDSVDQQPAGLYYFDYAGGRLDTDCIRLSLRGVSSLRVVNGNEVSQRLYGDITLVAGANISLTPVLQDNADPILIINAISGAGLTETCVCDTEDVTAPPIRTINDIPPDAGGNFSLLGSNCLEISPISHGLRLTDVCSEPCCGCRELEAITRTIEQFGNSATTLTNFVNRLEAVTTQFSNVVLGSRLADGGCVVAV